MCVDCGGNIVEIKLIFGKSDVEMKIWEGDFFSGLIMDALREKTHY